ncbi:MAG: hypothetical protein OXG46_09720 [Chloroflexi bacterium]|nr:hypothetical protein [Chloroflexota bacterium]MCY3939024.1 hypothetical protein [Chloroflexota bacterium]
MSSFEAAVAGVGGPALKATAVARSNPAWEEPLIPDYYCACGQHGKSSATDAAWDMQLKLREEGE